MVLVVEMLRVNTPLRTPSVVLNVCSLDEVQLVAAVMVRGVVFPFRIVLITSIAWSLAFTVSGVPKAKALVVVATELTTCEFVSGVV